MKKEREGKGSLSSFLPSHLAVDPISCLGVLGLCFLPLVIMSGGQKVIVVN